MRSRKIPLRPLMAAAMMAVMVVPSPAAAAAMPPSHEDDVPVLALRVFPEAWLPLETGRSVPDPAGGFTPKPTPPPAYPELGFMELAKRQVKSVTGYTMSPNTCGFISSSRAAGAFTCLAADATCSGIGSFMGCCSSRTCAAALTTCFPSSRASSCSGSAIPGVLCCSASSRGFCSTYLLSRSTATSNVLTLFACGTAAGTGTLLDFPVDYTQTSISTRTTSTTRTTSSSRSSSSSTTTPSRTDRDAGASTNTPPPGGQGEQQPQNQSAVGAIVGGVIGGAAVLALAALAIFFLVRRARRKGAPAKHSPLPPNAPAPSQPFMGPQTFPPTSPYQPPSASPHLPPYPPLAPFGGAGAGGGGGGGFVPQGYPTSTGYMIPPQQHQQAGGVSPYNSVAGDSMFAYPSMSQYGGSPMAPNSSPQMPYGDQGAAAAMTTTYSAYDPAYAQQPQVQRPPVEYKAYNPNMAPQAGPPPGRTQGPQEMA